MSVTTNLRPRARRLGIGLAIAMAATITVPASQAQAAPSAEPKPTAARGVTPASIIAKGATSVQMRVTDRRNRSTDTNRGHATNTGAPLVNQSKFRAASFTKLVTATAVMKLVEQRKLGLDDPVDKHLPGHYTFGKKVTVRQLLSHTSGLPTNAYERHLPSEPSKGDPLTETQDFLKQDYTDKQLRGYINKTGLKYAPGTTWEYSNANYVIAGQLIEAITHLPYQVYVSLAILWPQRMWQTSLPERGDRMLPPYARGYLPSTFYGKPTGPQIDTTRQSGTLFMAAGSMVTTTGDANRFLDALFEGRIVSRKSLAAMQREVVDNSLNYGLGMMQIQTPCGTARGHNGNTYGYTTVALSLNGKSVTVAVTEGKAQYASLSPDAQMLALQTLCPALKSAAKK